jgi:hypothetical protein
MAERVAYLRLLSGERVFAACFNPDSRFRLLSARVWPSLAPGRSVSSMTALLVGLWQARA